MYAFVHVMALQV